MEKNPYRYFNQVLTSSKWFKTSVYLFRFAGLSMKWDENVFLIANNDHAHGKWITIIIIIIDYDCIRMCQNILLTIKLVKKLTSAHKFPHQLIIYFFTQWKKCVSDIIMTSLRGSCTIHISFDVCTFLKPNWIILLKCCLLTIRTCW